MSFEGGHLLRSVHDYFRFLTAGLILGLFTEFLLRIVAGIKPEAFGLAVVFYPVFLTLAFFASRVLDRRIPDAWKADIAHYVLSGLGGLAVEWNLLGNGPGSNAIQIGMWAMWTTFCFGPRVLVRKPALFSGSNRRLWLAFGIVSTILTLSVLVMPARDQKVVVAVLGLTISYVLWSVWLLVMARRG